MKKMVRQIYSKALGHSWRRLQVRVGRKWIDVMDIEDGDRADEIVRPIQKAFDALPPPSRGS